MNFLLIAIPLLAILGLSALLTKGASELYQHRRCMGNIWRKEFPDSPKEDIRQFLWFFASAFAIPRRQALWLKPDDELMAIYRARYPRRDMPDALEFEVLSKDLQKDHQLSLEDVWHDRLTLGELFTKLSQSRLKGLN